MGRSFPPGRYWPQMYAARVGEQDAALPVNYTLTESGTAVLDNPEGAAEPEFEGGQQGWYGHHADWGHAPQYTPEGGAECDCGETFSPQQNELEAG